MTELARRLEALLEDLERWRDASCPECGVPLCHHVVLMSVATGYKDGPMCLPCLAAAVGRDPERLRTELIGYILSKDCHEAAWKWAGRNEPAGCSLAARGAAPSADAEWDSGEMACGDLVLELRIRMQSMDPGKILKLTARDPGAPQDLPAWCRLTGHSLLHSEHPAYWIRRRD
jgi:tRNA 2-thiouridine synthesizing protein A